MKSIRTFVGLILCFVFSSQGSSKDCQVKYGELVDFEICENAHLPDFDAHYKGITHPYSVEVMVCRNYEAKLKKTDTMVEFKYCHTGELGGDQELTLDKVKFTVIFDVPKGCAHQKKRGHIFFSPSLSQEALRKFQEMTDREQRMCRG